MKLFWRKKWSYKCECRCTNVYVYIMYICSLPACVFAVMYVGWTMSADLSDVLRVSCSYGLRSPCRHWCPSSRYDILPLLSEGVRILGLKEPNDPRNTKR